MALVLDLLEGGSLAALLARRGRLRPGEVVTAVAPVAAALAHAHEQASCTATSRPGTSSSPRRAGRCSTDLGVARVLGETPADEVTPAYVDPSWPAAGSRGRPRTSSGWPPPRSTRSPVSRPAGRRPGGALALAAAGCCRTSSCWRRGRRRSCSPWSAGAVRRTRRPGDRGRVRPGPAARLPARAGAAARTVCPTPSWPDRARGPDGTDPPGARVGSAAPHAAERSAEPSGDAASCPTGWSRRRRAPRCVVGAVAGGGRRRVRSLRRRGALGAAGRQARPPRLRRPVRRSRSPRRRSTRGRDPRVADRLDGRGRRAVPPSGGRLHRARRRRRIPRAGHGLRAREQPAGRPTKRRCGALARARRYAARIRSHGRAGHPRIHRRRSHRAQSWSTGGRATTSSLQVRPVGDAAAHRPGAAGRRTCAGPAADGGGMADRRRRTAGLNLVALSRARGRPGERWPDRCA